MSHCPATFRHRLPRCLLVSYVLTAAVLANLSGYGMPSHKYGWRHGWPLFYLARTSALVPKGPDPSPDDPAYAQSSGQLPFDRAQIVRFRFQPLLVNGTVAALAVALVLWAHELLGRFRRHGDASAARSVCLLVQIVAAAYCFGFALIGPGDMAYHIAGLLIGLMAALGLLAALFALFKRRGNGSRGRVVPVACLLLVPAGFVAYAAFPYTDLSPYPGLPPVAPSTFGLVTCVSAAAWLVWAGTAWAAGRLPSAWRAGRYTRPVARLAACAAIPMVGVSVPWLWYWPASGGHFGLGDLATRILLLMLWPLLVSSDILVVRCDRKQNLALNLVRAITGLAILGIAASVLMEARYLAIFQRLYAGEDLALFSGVALLWVVQWVPLPGKPAHRGAPAGP